MYQKNNKKENIQHKAYLTAWWIRTEEQNMLLQASVEQMQKDIEKQDELNKKFEMMQEHPEWFETTSPKQYGMNINKHKYGRHQRITK